MPKGSVKASWWASWALGIGASGGLVVLGLGQAGDLVGDKVGGLGAGALAGSASGLGPPKPPRDQF